jgi:hypothetical protein
MTVLTGRPLPRFHRFDRRRRENFGKAHEFLLQAIEILQGDDKLALRATGALHETILRLERTTARVTELTALRRVVKHAST